MHRLRRFRTLHPKEGILKTQTKKAPYGAFFVCLFARVLKKRTFLLYYSLGKKHSHAFGRSLGARFQRTQTIIGVIFSFMLQLTDICKEYSVGSLRQTALDHISLSFRDCEFAAILGPSGSGKTTLLNIIGGLDRYDSGDLVIGGVTTKAYSDRDWDAYRNHTVGFIFQSYNLIPHQSVLANVELALTISGISSKEKTTRALEALQKVGLKEHALKRPNQLSGGQMQRVAIARALVNDPDILLADEPTGALDTETSLQVMDLLKEVARDRLVVMVTHNPELAQSYASRIVHLKDGRILSDSDPFTPDAQQPASHKSMGRASMSFLAALRLSFNNLLTKRARTILVSLAGSIGIIGIALILSLSVGGTNYIENIERSTLSQYPLTITRAGMDLASAVQSVGAPEAGEDPVRERPVVGGMFAGVNTNDLSSLKAYLDSEESGIASYAQAVEYSYDVEPLIYRMAYGKPRQLHPDTTFDALGFSTSSAAASFFPASMMGTNIFHALPKDSDLYMEQYKVLAGRWPESYSECVVVLSTDESASDLMLYQVGLKDSRELDAIVDRFLSGEKDEVDIKASRYRYEDFLGLSFKLVSRADLYQYDGEYRLWKDKSGDQDFLRRAVQNGEDLKVVGVVKPVSQDAATILEMGLCYPASLTEHCIQSAGEKPIVKQQLQNERFNVFSGSNFGEDSESELLQMDSLISVDEDAVKDAFSFDSDALDLEDSFDLSGLDTRNLIDWSKLDLSSLSMPSENLLKRLQAIEFTLSDRQMQPAFSSLSQDFAAWAARDSRTDYSNLGPSVEGYLATDAAQEIISSYLQSALMQQDREAITARYLADTLDEVLLANLSAGGEDSTNSISAYLYSAGGQELLREKAYGLQRSLYADSLNNVDLSALGRALALGYTDYARSYSLPDPSLFRGAFLDYLDSDRCQDTLIRGLYAGGNLDGLSYQLAEAVRLSAQEYIDDVQGQISGLFSQVMRQISRRISREIAKNAEDLSESFGSAFSVDGDAFANAIQFNLSEQELSEVVLSMMSKDSASYADNLKKLGYADPNDPSSISIYPLGFEEKTAILNLLDGYNERMLSSGQEEKKIVYSDMVGLLMSSVTNIIDIISKILIAFVAISLVVSSIMIGVITYISVLERQKEIGILRAIGASKRNISQVFNAETFIIGLLAGILGVAITEALLIPLNIIVHSLTGAADFQAFLPPLSAAALVVISVILTLIGGLIPAKKAAKSDPVAALRSE